MKQFALVAGAGLLAYYLFRDQIKFAISGETTDTEKPAEGQPDDEPAGQPPTPPSTTKSLVWERARAEASKTGKLGFDAWNFYYHQTPQGAAHPAPAIETVFPGIDRATPMTIDEWWAGVSQHGLSGIRRRAWGIDMRVQLQGLGQTQDELYELYAEQQDLWWKIEDLEKKLKGGTTVSISAWLKQHSTAVYLSAAVLFVLALFTGRRR